ncbi:MAG: NAD(P)/FAD-dependent oxidoreductase [Mesorhizobium sp.]|nr:MAG: NAD(P)/FAD-dependent oxidoreductase [Mesorhizobium sp.]
MKSWTRREFGRLTGAALLTALNQPKARGQAKARVVVIGGGIGGATVARYLASSATAVDVTLVEPRQSYTTCFFSNLYLAGLRQFESLGHGYEALARQYGITVIHESAAAIHPAAKTVALNNGSKLSYDRLVVAPGIAFRDRALEGYDDAAMEIMPHAWNAGQQTMLLRQQLESMEDGGLFVLVAPPNPFRCPPAPYERASLVASYFQRRKPKAKILILDAKDSFNAQDLFQDAWNRHYPGMIEWLPAQFTGGVTAVDAKTRSVITAGATFKAAVANVIPAQMAGRLAQQAGLANRSGWCPVDPVTFESALQPGIYLVGDAIIGGDMPKSAFCANSQAKACAFAIAADLTGSARFPAHLFNTCYTYLAPDDAFSNAISFKPVDGKLKSVISFVSKVEESSEVRRQAARAAEGWYDAFTHDVFG